MSTEQNYVGRENYANPYKDQLTNLVAQIAALSQEPEPQVWERLYELAHCFYGVDIPSLSREGGESLLCVAERHDLLDKLLLIGQAELLQYI